MHRPDRPALYDEDGRRSWDDLVQEMTASGEVAPEQLDLSGASLQAAWQWLLPRLRRRPEDEPVDEADQPPWWDGPSWRRYAAWDDVTHHRISGVAHRLRQVLLAQPGATAGVGEADTVDAGEPVVVFDDRPDVNALRAVKLVLADVWDGRADPDALARVVDVRPPALPAELLWPTRLVLRMRAPTAGLLRKQRGLGPATIVSGLSELLQQPLEPPTAAGRSRVEHLGDEDWRAVVTLVGDSKRLRDVEIVVGAPRDEPVTQGRDRAVRALLHGLLDLAERAGAEVEVVDALPDDQHVARPDGRLSTSRLEEVLTAVGL